MVVGVILNTETKGEFFVNRTAGGDFLVKTSDMKSLGLSVVRGRTQEIEGEQYISLKSMGGVTFSFNENTLSLKITADPSLFPERTLDFMPRRPPNIYYPKDSAAFLNYGLGYGAGNSFTFQDFNLNNQLGARAGSLLFLTDTSYTKTPEHSTFVRLMSSLTYDRRDDLQRFIAGDFVASSGDLGSSVTLGGLSFSKIYDIDPYLIRYPTAHFTGFASLPSTMEVYMNKIRIGTEKLSPGEFMLNNLYYYGGANNVEVVIKDAFGRVQIVRYPFYFTDILLRKGLHEYSYNVGMIRNDLGFESNNYSGFAYSGFHRYGVADDFSIGISSEGGRGNYSLGAQASFLMRKAGVATLSLAGSRNADNRAGLAGTVNYGYQNARMNTQAFFRGFTKDYATIGSELLLDKTKYETGAVFGYSNERLGSFSFFFDKVSKYVGQDSRSFGISYSRNLSRKLMLLASFTHRNEIASSNNFLVGLTYYPREETVVSSNFERSAGLNSETVQVQKNPPVGQGFGYRASFSNAQTGSGDVTTVNPSFQYNGRYGIYTAEYSRQSASSGGADLYNLTAAGSIAYIGNTFGFSRPINDSFALAKVANLEGVRVYQNNEEIGRTDASGRVFLPNLGSYYDNQISINDKDIPMNYSIKEVVRYVSPPLRSGSLIAFEASKFQAITGKLNSKMTGQVMPAEFCELGITVNGKEVTSPTGRGGEFYFENIRPGKHHATLSCQEKQCSFDIIIPENDEMIIDLGRLVCEEMR